MKLTPEVKAILEKDGFFDLKEVDGVICGLQRFMFTIGLMVNITVEDFCGIPGGVYEYRYCYPYEKTAECLVDLVLYKYGVDPLGGWIKQKGGHIDRVNPAIEDEWLNSRK